MALQARRYAGVSERSSIMEKLEKFRDLLTQQDEVDDVEVVKDQYLRASFANRINPKEPHSLVVHPIAE